MAQPHNRNIPKTTKVYNEQGKVQMQIYYNPACDCKVYTEHYNDGKLYAKRTFKLFDKGEMIDGEDITYFYDGSIKIYRNWKDALPVGRFYYKHDNGKLEHEEFYEGKYKSGTWKYYDPFGRLIREQIYTPQKTLWNSKKDVAVYKYYRNGVLYKTEKINGGIKTVAGKKVAKTGTVKITTQDGKKLYQLKCKACHAIDKNGYGPSVGSFRKSSHKWLMAWIKDYEELIDAGDPHAVQLFKQWRNKKHTKMKDVLTDKQIQAIIKYLKL